MTALRQRMHDDLHLRNYSPLTLDAYLRCVAHFAQYFRTPPDRLGPEHIRQYQLYLVQERHLSWSRVIQIVSALRFFYRVTLEQPWMIAFIPHPKRPQTLPTLLEPSRSGDSLAGSRANSPAGPSSPRSMPLASGSRNCVTCTSRMSTVRAWCCASGRAKARRTAT